jgi:hypothetical protein
MEMLNGPRDSRKNPRPGPSRPSPDESREREEKDGVAEDARDPESWASRDSEEE